MSAIQNLSEPWDGLHNGDEIEAFLKSQLAKIGGKIGYLVCSPQVDQNSFYHLWGFASSDDYELYNSDPEEYEDLLLVNETLPISTVQGDSYGAYLFTNLNQTANIVVKEASFKLPLRFHAVRISSGERLNYGGKGTLRIQRSLDNGTTWTNVGTITGAIDSTSYSDTDTFTEIEIGKYLQKGYKQIIRVQGSFEYIDDDNVTKTLYTTWVQAASSITYTELKATCQLDWNNALQASQIRNSGFPISYKIDGAVDKTLYVEIYGQSTMTVEYSLSASENGTIFTRNVVDSSDTYKIFNHGVHKVRAKLVASNGLGETIESEWAENSFMVVDYATAGSNASKPYIMLQNVQTRVVNFVQSTVCEYAVFNPVVSGETITAGNTPVDVTFYLTQYDNSFSPSGSTTKYFESNSLVTPNTKSSITTTIEIESDNTSDIVTCFRVWRKAGGTDYNFLFESQSLNFLSITVDNSNNFSPTIGATFILNPKVRNNSEQNPQRILNAASDNAVVSSTWTGFDMMSDGWVVDSDNIKVLRVLAGERLNIRLNPFAQFINSPDSAMTMEFDIAVRNVTDEDSAILNVFERVGANPRGLSIKPMEGNLYTKSAIGANETNFRFCEDKRTHIVINIHNNIRPNVNGDGLPDPNIQTPQESIAVARVFINGNIEREVLFSTAANDEFCTSSMSNNGIVIGQNGADIDIYGIRIYATRQLSAQDVVKDYIATLPTSDEKVAVRAQNDIMTSGRVDIEKVKALGKRILILHGLEPYMYRQKVASVWWEIFQYNADGTLNNDLSGTICRETGMKPKRQGSTANTYYYSNIQTKIDDGGTIQIPLSQFHSSIHVSEPYQSGNKTVVGIYGGNLGAKDPVVNEPKEYDYEDGLVSVPDGWIDGNGMYRGMGFMITEGTPLATKLVLKVNYASSMQSHLCAGTRLYNDLHTAVVGRNSLQQAVPSARVTKYTEPVYFFTQDGDNSPVFRGGGNFGAGKMDKPTWGYVKSLHPMFTMIEGSDNNFPLTDMRVPFITDERCGEAITYSPDDEGYFYNGLQCLDFDAGKTTKDSSGNEWPADAITNRLSEVWNFIYLHTPMIRYYVGTFNDFQLSPESENTTYKYWCTDGTDAYKLKRYNFVSGMWVDAGLWTYENGYSVIDIRTDSMTEATYTASTHKTDYEELNKEIISAIAAHAKKYIGFYFNVNSLKFHYVFQNHFMAGTDNCSKNTYFVLDPLAKSVTIDGETRSCYLFELHQDDVDTIFITDNNGRSTKPYYIDRMHPYRDNDTSENPTSCYEGTMNGLFNLVETMWEDSKELQSTMRSVFNAMVGLISQEDNNNGFSSSIWGCLEKYFFSIQHFYSQMAYNEQARIRYEWPALLGFVSTGSGARGVEPITQSMGSQLEAETQFMLRRVVYMASYAAWGNLYDGGKTYSIGVPDVTASLSLQAYHLPPYQSNENNYTFNVKAHQYIYPTGMLGQTSVDPHVRVAPNQTFALNLGSTTSNDTGMSILGANYYRSFGNVGDISVAPEVTFTVLGKRLVEFVAEPTVTYTENGKTVGAFRPDQIRFNAPQIKHISLMGSGIGGAVDLTGLNRLEIFDARDTNIFDITLPSSVMMREVYFPDTISRLALRNAINLTTVSIGSLSHLATLDVDQVTVPQINIMSLILHARNDHAPLANVTANVNWTNCTTELLDFLVGLNTSDIRGTINIANTDLVTFEQKMSYLRWGNIDDPSNRLYISYTLLNISHVFIKGQKYFTNTGNYKLDFTTDDGNNILIENGVTAAHWSIESNSKIEVTNANTGEIRVKALNAEGDTNRYTITLTITLIDSTTVTATWKLGAFRRLPVRGDFAYADGSFDDEVIGGKTMVGYVYEISDVYEGGALTYRNLEICSFSAPIITSTDKSINTNVLTWGIEQNTSAGSFTEEAVNEISAASNNTPLVSITIGTALDTASRLRTMTLVNTAIAVIRGYITSIMRDADISQYQGSVTAGVLAAMYKTKSMITQAKLPQNGTELADMMEGFENYMVLQGNTNGSNRYRQLFYPAAYAMYLYEPTIKDNETLHVSYRVNNWFLPAVEVAYTLWTMHHASRGKSANNAVSSDYANEDNTVANADYPLYSNLLQRLESAGVSTTALSIFNHDWIQSTTEVSAWINYLIRRSDGYKSGTWYHNKGGTGYCAAITTFRFDII